MVQIHIAKDLDNHVRATAGAMTVDELLARFPEVPRDLQAEPVLERYVAAFGPRGRGRRHGARVLHASRERPRDLRGRPGAARPDARAAPGDARRACEAAGDLRLHARAAEGARRAPRRLPLTRGSPQTSRERLRSLFAWETPTPRREPRGVRVTSRIGRSAAGVL
jgi:hypothetical protein